MAIDKGVESKGFTRERPVNPGQFSEERIAEMVVGVASYFRNDRALYLPHSQTLPSEWRAKIAPYFSAQTLDLVKILELDHGVRVPPPPFYAEALEMTGGKFPDFVHMASITYVDVIVFNEGIEARALFHGMVHVAQIAHLGFDEYVKWYVRGFLKHLSWLAIPFEDQAYKLDARFAQAPNDLFSVEEEIRDWQKLGKYR
jgi:hypothetical protein